MDIRALLSSGSELHIYKMVLRIRFINIILYDIVYYLKHEQTHHKYPDVLFTCIVHMGDSVFTTTSLRIARKFHALPPPSTIK